MTISKLLLTAMSLAVLSSTASVAAELQHLKITSDLLIGDYYLEQSSLTLPSRIEISVTIDPTVEGVIEPDFTDHPNAVTMIDVALLDEAGEVLAWDWPLSYALSGEGFTAVQTRIENDFSAFSIGVIEADSGIVVELVPRDDYPLFALTDGFPALNEATAEMPGNFSLALTGLAAGDIAYQLVFSSGTITYVSQVTDADGDGVADADDLCVATEVSDTVVFDGVNSGVTNTIDATGCSIMDRYAACSTELSSELHYSGPNYCQTQLGYQLYREGVITYTELRMLRNAL